jgi:exosortase H (IPTLxxWG-CTERM-specific)
VSDRDLPPGGAPNPATRDPWIRFTLTFAALAVVSELVYYGVALESALFRDYLAALARASAWMLSLFLPGVRADGTAITSDVFSVEIARGCDAYRMCALLTAAIVAFPAAIPRKLWGIALGLAWLNLLNFVRIIGLFLIGGYARSEFQRSHEIYFPVFLIAMTVAAWIFWVRRATHDRLRPNAVPA